MPARLAAVLCLAGLASAPPSPAAYAPALPWPQWRGPTRDGRTTGPA